MNTIECPVGHVRIESSFTGCPYCELSKKIVALNNAKTGFELAYDALEKKLYDEAMLHCGHHFAQIEKVLRGSSPERSIQECIAKHTVYQPSDEE